MIISTTTSQLLQILSMNFPNSLMKLETIRNGGQNGQGTFQQIFWSQPNSTIWTRSTVGRQRQWSWQIIQVNKHLQMHLSPSMWRSLPSTQDRILALINLERTLRLNRPMKFRSFNRHKIWLKESSSKRQNMLSTRDGHHLRVNFLEGKQK